MDGNRLLGLSFQVQSDMQDGLGLPGERVAGGDNPFSKFNGSLAISNDARPLRSEILEGMVRLGEFSDLPIQLAADVIPPMDSMARLPQNGGGAHIPGVNLTRRFNEGFCEDLGGDANDGRVELSGIFRRGAAGVGSGPALYCADFRGIPPPKLHSGGVYNPPPAPSLPKPATLGDHPTVLYNPQSTSIKAKKAPSVLYGAARTNVSNSTTTLAGKGGARLAQRVDSRKRPLILYDTTLQSCHPPACSQNAASVEIGNIFRTTGLSSKANPPPKQHSLCDQQFDVASVRKRVRPSPGLDAVLYRPLQGTSSVHGSATSSDCFTRENGVETFELRPVCEEVGMVVAQTPEDNNNVYLHSNEELEDNHNAVGFDDYNDCNDYNDYNEVEAGRKVAVDVGIPGKGTGSDWDAVNGLGLSEPDLQCNLECEESLGGDSGMEWSQDQNDSEVESQPTPEEIRLFESVQAVNARMTDVDFPGEFVPVARQSRLFKLGLRYKFCASGIVIASSYIQKLESTLQWSIDNTTAQDIERGRRFDRMELECMALVLASKVHASGASLYNVVQMLRDFGWKKYCRDQAAQLEHEFLDAINWVLVPCGNEDATD